VAPGRARKGEVEVQPTEMQVQRSLAALRAAAKPTGAGMGDDGVWSPGLPAGLIELLSTVPAIRLDRMLDARRHLEGGAPPSDEDVADRLVGRLVCDRLR
jgi:hypothetical protein